MTAPLDLRVAPPPAMSMRDMVIAIEAAMVADPAGVLGDEIAWRLELPVKHHFARGVYARELFIPKGAMLTGQIHKYPQINIMSRGDLAVLVGNRVTRLNARNGPIIVASAAGTKRIAYAHADTVWTTIHGTNETDVDKIEAHFIAKSDEDYEAFLEQAQVKEIA